MNKQTYLHIAEPCHENWNAMNPVDLGRFCLSCSKKVVDFTAKTDQEILAILSNAAASTCGRFRNEQLQRPLQQPQSMVLTPLKLAAAAMIPMAIITTAAVAQTSKGEVAPKKARVEMPRMTAGLVAVFEPTKKPEAKQATKSKTKPAQTTSGARALHEDKAKPRTVKRDTTGENCGKPSVISPVVQSNPGKIWMGKPAFRNEVSDKPPIPTPLLSSDTLVVAPLPSDQPDTKPAAVLFGEVILVKPVPKQTEFKTMVQKVAGTHVFKVLPNPLSPGMEFSLKFTRTGTFDIQVFNNAGSLFLAKQLAVTNVQQLSQLSLPATMLSGSYFVRATQQGSKKTFVDKIIVR